MKQLRPIGTFLIVCSVICGLVAYERYQRSKATAMAIAEQLEEVDFVSVEIPLESKVAGFLAMVLLVAGLRCVYEAFRKPSDQLQTDQLRKPL